MNNAREIRVFEMISQKYTPENPPETTSPFLSLSLSPTLSLVKTRFPPSLSSSNLGFPPVSPNHQKLSKQSSPKAHFDRLKVPSPQSNSAMLAVTGKRRYLNDARKKGLILHFGRAAGQDGKKVVRERKREKWFF